ncbi:Peptidase family M23 [Syntrophus gentianae]|uniref:Peptidase family M23 n=1 Tax=Syntrophus gentianae TaxID=43775 RepID=A0A1H7WXB8_9BACT|nr:M23 family metallopeptidase [Syntrophus gentianae]SEM26246.1 Peptidase family M23 [Syntrophus gentianae]
MTFTQSKKNLTPYIIVPAVLVVIALAAWLFLGHRFEFGKPIFTFDGELRTIGWQSTVNLTFSDPQSGLSKTELVLIQDGRTYPLSALTYPSGKVKTQKIRMVLDPAKIKVHEGPATLHISATDCALFSNSISVDKPVMIDFGPPQIFPLNTQNHINPGGTCVVAYRVSEPVTMTGILVDSSFCKAYPISLSGKPAFIAYFPVPMEAGNRPVNIRIVARDQGGNESSSTVPYLLLNKTFRSDKMMLSESFLQRKMPEFQAANPQLRGKTLLDTFIYVNTQMRAENFKTIQGLSAKSEPRQLWNDTFLRMKNASPMALFGDRRTYIYGGQQVGESIHEGVDLASTTQAPIEAANNGIVVFAGPLGIYGNTVMIDHGFGLFTLYAHLSTISVKSAQTVSMGSVIGSSGLSGLAGGDHLHFGMMVGGQFVNPQEWWDPHWIKDNVLRKMEVGI